MQKEKSLIVLNHNLRCWRIWCQDKVVQLRSILSLLCWMIISRGSTLYRFKRLNSRPVKYPRMKCSSNLAEIHQRKSSIRRWIQGRALKEYFNIKIKNKWEKLFQLIVQKTILKKVLICLFRWTLASIEMITNLDKQHIFCQMIIYQKVAWALANTFKRIAIHQFKTKQQQTPRFLQSHRFVNHLTAVLQAWNPFLFEHPRTYTKTTLIKWFNNHRQGKLLHLHLTKCF